MSRWYADFIVVVVKPLASEDMVTYLRIKLEAKSRKLKAKGETG
jgi:hypothetical protein